MEVAFQSSSALALVVVGNDGVIGESEMVGMLSVEAVVGNFETIAVGASVSIATTEDGASDDAVPLRDKGMRPSATVGVEDGALDGEEKMESPQARLPESSSCVRN